MQVKHVIQATAQSTGDRAGWPLKEYLPLVGFGPTTFHTMPAELKPRFVKIGKKIIVVEHPKEYMARIAALQSEPEAA